MSSHHSNLLTDAQVSHLSSARRRALRRTIKVSAHERSIYSLRDPALRRLAQWDGVETLVVRLCKHVDRHGVLPDDKRTAWRLITLIEETFEINPRS